MLLIVFSSSVFSRANGHSHCALLQHQLLVCLWTLSVLLCYHSYSHSNGVVNMNQYHDFLSTEKKRKQNKSEPLWVTKCLDGFGINDETKGAELQRRSLKILEERSTKR